MTASRKETHRAYLAPLPRLTLARQAAMAEAAGCGVVYGHATRRGKDVGDRKDFDLWVSSLRPGDVAWVPDLRVLVPAGVRHPSRAMSVAVASILARGAVLVDGMHGARSDSKEWPEQIDAALRRLQQGRRDPKEQRASARKASDAALASREASSIRKQWESDAYRAKREAMRPLWMSMEYKSDAAAQSALPDPDLRAVSTDTLRRIFGRRRDGRLHFGGRPPAKRKG